MWSWVMAENGTSFSPDRALIHAVEYPNRATVYVAIIIAFTVLLSSFKRSSTQKLAPGVMVVGGSEKQTIRANRERFRENAKEMLEEGYRKVRGGNVTPAAALQRTDQPTTVGEWLFLRAQPTWRAADDTGQVSRRVKDSPNRRGGLRCYVHRGKSTRRISRPGSIGWVLMKIDVRGQIYYHG